MNLAPCPSCGQQVSRKADRCPSCGYPIHRGFLGRAGTERTLNIILLIGLLALCWMCVCGGCPAVTRAAEPAPDEIKAFIAESRQQAAKAIAGLTDDIARAEEYLRKNRRRLSSEQRERQEQKIAELEAERERLRLGGVYLAKFPSDKLPSKGQIGRLYDDDVNVLQVIDDRTALIRITLNEPVFVPRGNSGYWGTKARLETLWIEGIDASSWLDGRGAKVPDLFIVVGTKRYETAAGSNTVLHLQRLNEEVVLPQFQSTPSSSFRTWTDATGMFSVEAEFVEVKNSEAVLRKKGGDEISVPLSRLSDDDQEWIKEQAGKD